MGLLGGKKPSLEEMEEEKDRLVVEGDLESARAVVEEKKAIITKLKASYGSGWRKILGAVGLNDLQSLRTLLGRVKAGYTHQIGTDTMERLRQATTVGRPKGR